MFVHGFICFSLNLFSVAFLFFTLTFYKVCCTFHFSFVYLFDFASYICHTVVLNYYFAFCFWIFAFSSNCFDSRTRTCVDPPRSVFLGCVSSSCVQYAFIDSSEIHGCETQRSSHQGKCFHVSLFNNTFSLFFVCTCCTFCASCALGTNQSSHLLHVVDLFFSTVTHRTCFASYMLHSFYISRFCISFFPCCTFTLFFSLSSFFFFFFSCVGVHQVPHWWPGTG